MRRLRLRRRRGGAGRSAARATHRHTPPSGEGGAARALLVTHSGVWRGGRSPRRSGAGSAEQDPPTRLAVTGQVRGAVSGDSYRTGTV